MARKEITLDKVEGNVFELQMDGCGYIVTREELENLIKNLSKDSERGEEWWLILNTKRY